MIRMLALVVTLLLPVAATAGAPYDAANGFAVSGYDPVAYRSLAPGDPAVPGHPDITLDWNGGTYAFATEDNRAAFEADPAAYAPAFDGHCVFAASRGYKAAGHPDIWEVLDGVLYLNLSERAYELWAEDKAGNNAMARENWVDLEPQPAADGLPASFDPASAPVE